MTHEPDSDFEVARRHDSAGGTSVRVNQGQMFDVRGHGPVHAPLAVQGDYIASQTVQQPPVDVYWPVRVGVMPTLADQFQARSGPQSELDAALAPGTTAVLTQVLSGLGGNGKTQLAAALARQLFDDGQLDLVAWVTAISRDSILSGYAGIARQVGLPAAALDPEQAAVAFLNWAETTGKRWLLVLDDLADPTDLTGLWPTGAAGRVVVTTRRHDAVLSDRGRQLVDVGLFTEPEALAYLTAKIPAGQLDEPEALATDLGLLPLALAQAAAVIKQQGWTCSGYRARFASHRRTLADMLPVDATADDYATGPHAAQRATIATTWTLSIAAADQLAPTGLGSVILQIASLLDPNGIPVELFTTDYVCQYLRERESLAAADESASGEADDGLDEDSVRRALGNLWRLSLAELDAPPARATTIRVHSLIQRAVRDAFEPAEIANLAGVTGHSLLEIWPERDYLPEHALLAASLRTNASTLQENVGISLLSACQDLVYKVGASFNSSGLVHQALAYWQRVAPQTVRALGADDPNTISCQAWLGFAYKRAGRYAEVIPLTEVSLAGHIRVYGTEHPDTLRIQNNLAMAYQAVGRHADAIRLLETTLADSERLFGSEHPDTLNGRNNLATSYYYGDRYADAIPLLEATLDDYERLLGVEHLNTLHTRNNLAIAYGAVGRHSDAVSLLETNLIDRERLLGSEHPDTLASRNNLAVSYDALGRHADAIPLLEAVHDDCERLLGAEHPDTLNSRKNLAMTYQVVGRHADAIPLLETTLADYERLLGSEHPDTVRVRENFRLATEQA